MQKDRKLKIGLVFDDTLDSSDGVAQYVKTLGAWLSGQGHDVRYLVGETSLAEWSGGKIYSLAKNLGVRFNGNKLSIPGPASRRRIKRILDQEQFDVLHVQVPYSPLLAGQVINLAAKNTAIIGTFHIFPAGPVSRAGSHLLRLALTRSLKKFDQLLSVSAAANQFAHTTFHMDSIVVPNMVEVSKFRPRTSKGAKQEDIVFLGRLVGRKGCLQLLKAFRLLHQKMPETKLVIAGDGPQRAALEKYVAANGLQENVEFKGFVSEKLKAKLLSDAAIACFPSLYGESFGIVLIEAMAAGSGVVLAGDNPGYRSVLGAQAHLLINPLATRAFAERLELILSDKPLAGSLHAWQEAAIGQYDVNIVSAKVIAVYQAAIDIKSLNRHNKANEK